MRLVLKAAFALLPTAALAVTVSTAQFGNARTAANTAETVITQANVPNIHKLGTFAVDGKVYAQPLVIDQVLIGGASRVLVVVTMHNSVYLFDADRPGTAAIWTVNLGTSYPENGYPIINDFFHDEIGCLSTPVLDEFTLVLYAVCNINGVNKIHSMNLSDGTAFHAPVTIAGSNNGVTFSSTRHMFRPALTLLNGIVYAAAAGYGDTDPYQGWVFGYDKTTLTQTAIWADVSTTTGEGGIWMTGGGLASDGTDLFVSTGNGTFASNNYGSSFVRLSALLSPLDYATPANFATLNGTDKDINSGHVMYVSSSPGYVVGGGKDGRFWVLDKTAMGGLEGVGVGPHQLSNLGNSGANFGCTVFANNALIISSLNNSMRRFSWDGSTFNSTPTAFGATSSSPGPACSYSSNGATAGTDIVWGVTPASSGFSSLVAGTLRAWNGTTLVELYNSGTAAGDALGNFAKFSMPTIANGKVFVATFSNQVSVYGFPPAVGTLTTGRTSTSGRTQ